MKRKTQVSSSKKPTPSKNNKSKDANQKIPTIPLQKESEGINPEAFGVLEFKKKKYRYYKDELEEMKIYEKWENVYKAIGLKILSKEKPMKNQPILNLSGNGQQFMEYLLKSNKPEDKPFSLLIELLKEMMNGAGEEAWWGINIIKENAFLFQAYFTSNDLASYVEFIQNELEDLDEDIIESLEDFVNNEYTQYLCYRCHKPVPLDELEDVDSQIENLEDDDATLVADEFVHTTGPASYFHGEGATNVCQSCLNDILGNSDDSDDSEADL